MATLGALPASAAGSEGPRSGRERVAIVGAGAGGVAAAYFLAGSFDVDLFEARSRIGGHCDSRVIEHRGRRITVDLGAQFFHPDTHPIYVTLLEELGLYDPEHPDVDATVEAPGSLCIFRTAGGAPIFSSSNPLSTPLRAVDFAMFTQLARQAVLTDMSWEITVDAWIRGLPLRRSFKKDVVYPWITATIGCAAGRRAASVGAVDPADVRSGVSRQRSRGRHHLHLEDRPAGEPATPPESQPDRPGAPQDACAGPEAQAGRWYLRTPAGRKGPYRFVVLNAPPRAGRVLLRPLPAFADITALLDVYGYFDSRLLVHTDAAYVHRDRRNWGAYNAGVDGLECEGSAWLGALQEKSASGATVHVFKSWAQRRRSDPKHILLERRFKHPVISRSTIKAARALRPLQGRRGLYFSGQYTTGMDLQESALYSAMEVAEALAPASQLHPAHQPRRPHRAIARSAMTASSARRSAQKRRFAVASSLSWGDSAATARAMAATSGGGVCGGAAVEPQ